MSSDIASRNLRRFSAARSFSVIAPSIFDSLVTPSTRRATCAPNSFSICAGVATVSSIVSWRMPVAIVSASSLSSVRMPATSIGWLKYGSPLARSWLPCACNEKT